MVSKAAPAERNDHRDATVIGEATTIVTGVGAQVRASASEITSLVVKKAPAALTVSRGFIVQVIAAFRESSTDSLALGTVFAAGVSGGLLLSRAPRVLVALAFVPTLVFGGALAGRRTTRLDEPSRGARA